MKSHKTTELPDSRIHNQSGSHPVVTGKEDRSTGFHWPRTSYSGSTISLTIRRVTGVYSTESSRSDTRRPTRLTGRSPTPRGDSMITNSDDRYTLYKREPSLVSMWFTGVRNFWSSEVTRHSDSYIGFRPRRSVILFKVLTQGTREDTRVEKRQSQGSVWQFNE